MERAGRVFVIFVRDVLLRVVQFMYFKRREILSKTAVCPNTDRLKIHKKKKKNV